MRYCAGMTPEQIYQFVCARGLAVLSTLHANGAPQSALIGIAFTHDCEVVFDTVKTSRKYSNLVRDGRCSLVIGWSSEITVQYEGVARELMGAELIAYQQIYFEKMPDGPQRLTWPGIVYFAVRPSWIRYSDYSVSPPLIEELRF